MPFALITGASKGIGKAIAGNLAERGYNLLLIARSEELLQTAAAEFTTTFRIKCYYLALDLATDQAADRVYAWCAENQFPITVLVNNAGYGLSGAFDKYEPEEIDNMLHLNILTLVKMTRLFLPGLRNKPAAYILNIGSSAAYQAVPFLSAYAASKAFVLSFSRGLRAELAGGPVSVTCICPGPTDTHFATRANLGERGLKAAERFNMDPETVGQLAVSALFKRKAELVTGGANKMSAFMAWLLPKSLVERVAKSLYE